MSAKYFLDTNILVYSFDQSANQKQIVANELITKALTDNCGIISYQVVQEFLNVSTRKFEKPMFTNEAQKYLSIVLEKLCAIFPSIDLYQHALNLAENTGYSFYDSLIIAAAIKAECQYLYSEDLQDGHLIEGLKIKNPF